MWFLFGEGSITGLLHGQFDLVEYIKFILITGFWCLLADLIQSNFKAMMESNGEEEEVGEGLDR